MCAVKNWLENLLQGARGRLIRVGFPLAVSYVSGKLQGYDWYVAATPLLNYLSKLVRDKYPGQFEWLPF